MILSLSGLNGKIKTLLDRLTSGRADALDYLDAPISDCAPASTAVSAADLTPTRAGKLDNLDQAISAISPLAQSVQFVSITLLGSDSSRTATITSVTTTKTVIIPLGYTTAATTGPDKDKEGCWELTNTTTVTFNRGHTGINSVTFKCVVVSLK